MLVYKRKGPNCKQFGPFYVAVVMHSWFRIRLAFVIEPFDDFFETCFFTIDQNTDTIDAGSNPGHK